VEGDYNERPDNYIEWMDAAWDTDARGNPVSFRGGLAALASLMIHEAVHQVQTGCPEHEWELPACRAQLSALDAIEAWLRRQRKLAADEEKKIEDMREVVEDYARQAAGAGGLLCGGDVY
jgi:hypothetical protein